jgi:DNA-binding GntR family transcriptional regulator
MRLQVSMATGKQRPAREHREIVRACRDGNVETAAKLLEAHVVYSQKALQAEAREAEQQRTRHKIASK